MEFSEHPFAKGELQVRNDLASFVVKVILRWRCTGRALKRLVFSSFPAGRDVAPENPNITKAHCAAGARTTAQYIVRGVQDVCVGAAACASFEAWAVLGYLSRLPE
jgi:hypothetical protein